MTGYAIILNQLPPGGFCADLTNEQFATIRKAIQEGRKLQERSPDLWIEFENKTLEELAVEYNVPNNNSEIVRKALIGYDGRYTVIKEEAYEGQLSLKKYKELAKKHIKNGVEKQKDAKQGIYSQTFEDHVAMGKRFAKDTGHEIWGDDEKLDALEMATKPGKEYQRGSRIAIGKIAKELNQKYNNHRTPRAVAKFLSDYNEGKRQ